VYQDVVTALAGASVAQPGVIVIAGTGSVAYGKLADGRSALAGGWGYIMGDEGSAYQIGLAALGAACRASDKRGPATTLLEHIPARLERSTLREVHKGIYSHAIMRPQIAGLAAVVGAAARDDNDTIAQAILTRAGRDLADAAIAVIEALNMVDTGMSVYTTGGVFHAGEFVLAPFRERIAARSSASASAVHEAAYSPVIGALFLAIQSAGTTLTDDVTQAIRDSAPKAAISKHLSQNE
jgi:N-acetylglucosamine kinase-like BadF-type ATPase